MKALAGLLGGSEGGDWRVSQKDHMNGDVGVTGVLGTGIRLGGST